MIDRALESVNTMSWPTIAVACQRKQMHMCMQRTLITSGFGNA